MTRDLPVRIDLVSPVRFDRVQLLLRLAVTLVVGWLGLSAGGTACMLYVLLPVMAAIAIATEGADGYLGYVGLQIWAVLVWLLRLSAYMLLVVDRFPIEGDRAVVIALRTTGRPTVGSALARVVTSIPSALLLMVLWCLATLVALFSGICVLVTRAVPHGMLGFQRGVLRWQARLLAYHASLVMVYPPLALDTDDQPVPDAAQASA